MEPYALRVDVDLDVIRHQYPVRRCVELAAELGINRKTLTTIALGLGLPPKRQHRRWHPHERRTLIRSWGHVPIAVLCERLGRSRCSIRAELRRQRRKATT